MNRLWQMINGEWRMANVGKFQTFVFCLLSFAFFITSCSTNKSTSNLRTLSANHIIREVERNQFEFDNLETKFNVRLEGNNIGLKGQLRMQNDSVIWVSLSLKLGIEVARVMITEDSVKFINRTNKTYFVESVDNLQEQFQERLPSEVTIGLIQDLLVGNDIQLSKNDKFKVTIDDNNYKLESDRNTFWITPKTFKVKSCQLSAVSYQQSAISSQQSAISSQRQWSESGSESTVSVSYDNFQYVNGKLLPTKIILNTNEDFDINLEIDYSEVKTGEKLELPFNISKKFKKI